MSMSVFAFAFAHFFLMFGLTQQVMFLHAGNRPPADRAIGRPMLHAAALELEHPVTGLPLRVRQGPCHLMFVAQFPLRTIPITFYDRQVVAPPPADFVALFPDVAALTSSTR